MGTGGLERVPRHFPRPGQHGTDPPPHPRPPARPPPLPRGAAPPHPVPPPALLTARLALTTEVRPRHTLAFSPRGAAFALLAGAGRLRVWKAE